MADGGGWSRVAYGGKQQQTAADCVGQRRTSETAVDGGRWGWSGAEGVDSMLEGCGGSDGSGVKKIAWVVVINSFFLPAATFFLLPFCPRLPPKQNIKIAVEIVQHPTEHDHVRMVMERHARVEGEDEYPHRVPPWQETYLCLSLRQKRSAESVPIPSMVCIQWRGGCDRHKALSEDERSSVEPQ